MRTLVVAFLVTGICQINSTCVGEIALATNTSPGDGGNPGSGVGVATGVGTGVGLGVGVATGVGIGVGLSVGVATGVGVGVGLGVGIGVGVGDGPPPIDVLTETAFEGADILIPPASKVLIIYT